MSPHLGERHSNSVWVNNLIQISRSICKCFASLSLGDNVVTCVQLLIQKVNGHRCVIIYNPHCVCVYVLLQRKITIIIHNVIHCMHLYFFATRCRQLIIKNSSESFYSSSLSCEFTVSCALLQKCYNWTRFAWSWTLKRRSTREICKIINTSSAHNRTTVEWDSYSLRLFALVSNYSFRARRCTH